MTVRTAAVGCPRWPIVSHDLPPGEAAAVFFANRVTSASPEAVACGIRRGMRRREAQARCPSVEVLAHNPARDMRTFEAIVSVVESFCPTVEVVRPGLCVFPARAPARYFGGEDALRAKIADAVDDAIAGQRTNPLHEDDRTRVGIADGPFAASLAATRGVIVPNGGSPEFLADFAIAVLDRPDLCDLLFRLGIRTLGELAALDRSRVVARFGAEGVIAHRMATGDDDRLLEPRPVPPDLVVVRELDPPARRVDIAMFSGKAAADELADRLTTLGLACAKLQITAETEHGEERTRTWRYSSAFTPQAIAERVRWQLEGWLQETSGLSGGIALIRLRPEDVGPAIGARVGFWERRGDVSDRVRRAIARVQGLLGPRGAQRPVLSGGRHPSEQISLVPWGDPPEPQRAGRPGTKTVQGPIETELPPWPGRLPSPSPSLVFAEPSHAELADAKGAAIGVTGRFALTGTPASARLKGKRWTPVVAWAGPWPTDEKWWDEDQHHRRARFQIALADGTAHLLTLEDGTLRLEASYD